ncbi:MAG TPA: hypothetical protein VGN63_06060 [Flavisolibacter sp.]|jgi:uncharacterized membrane protein|nr:hypothetical protein [Flavisolibacter sp.]
MHTTNDPRLISYQTIRKTIGWLGILLPAAMIVGNAVFGHCYTIQSSVSHYYYTLTGNLFTGILCAVALFLIAYKGYNRLDQLASSIAGGLALLIALFPTNMETLAALGTDKSNCIIFNLPANTLRNAVHYVSAGLFFLTLAFISWVLFTKGEAHPTHEKQLRNRVYRTCSILIVLCVLLIGVYGIWGKREDAVSRFKPVFFLEWIALLAFGTSWLVKGELLLKDKHYR